MEYYENGNIKSDAIYIDGKIKWETVFYYENGNIESEGYYKDDEKIGEWKVYYEETGILQGKYYNKNGIINGSYIIYYDRFDIPDKIFYSKNKKEFVKYEVQILNGKMQGEFRSYYPDGRKKEIGCYKNGVKEGIWELYSPNTSYIVIEEKIYTKGEEIEKKVYDDDRYLLSHSYWKNNLYYEDAFDKKRVLRRRAIYKQNIITKKLRRSEEIEYNEYGNKTNHKKYSKRFLEGDDPF